MSALGLPEQQRAVDVLFARLDTDGSGEISLKELSMVVRPLNSRRPLEVSAGSRRQGAHAVLTFRTHRVLPRAPPLRRLPTPGSACS